MCVLVIPLNYLKPRLGIFCSIEPRPWAGRGKSYIPCTDQPGSRKKLDDTAKAEQKVGCMPRLSALPYVFRKRNPKYVNPTVYL